MTARRRNLFILLLVAGLLAGSVLAVLTKETKLGLEWQVNDGKDPVGTALEWGVRVLDTPVVVHAEGDRPEPAKADIFPAYDDDGGLLLVLTPR